VGTLVLVLAARDRTPSLQRLATFAVLCLLLFSPLVAQEPLASVPADSVHGRPAILGARAEGAGRLFTSAIDRPLLMSWLYDGGAGWTENTPGRLHALLGGYHNLTAGVPTVGSASPIGSPRRARLLAVALTGGSAARTLGLVDTRHLLTPYPPSFHEARLVARTAAIGLFTLDGAMGRAFIARSVRAAPDDEVAAALRDDAFSPESVALTGPESRAALPAQPISFGTASKGRDGGSFGLVSIVRDVPEELELTATVSSSAFLVTHEVLRSRLERRGGQLARRAAPDVHRSRVFRSIPERIGSSFAIARRDSDWAFSSPPSPRASSSWPGSRPGRPCPRRGRPRPHDENTIFALFSLAPAASSGPSRTCASIGCRGTGRSSLHLPLPGMASPSPA
jgi:hypothetical protein